MTTAQPLANWAGSLRCSAARLHRPTSVAELRRVVAADDLWLSPAHGRDSVAFHVTWIADPGAVAPLLRAVEEALLPLGARPHWGKLFSLTPAELAGAVPRLRDFTALAQEFNPKGGFRHDLLAVWCSDASS